MTPTSKKIIFIAVLLAGCVLTSIFSSREQKEALSTPLVQQTAVQSAGKKPQPKSTALRVQVSGEVLEPGIYDLPANARVEEAVNAAGGFTENADTERVNLVRKLRDGMQVKVPALKAAKASTGKGTGGKQKLVGSVRINSASVSELEALPGVGPALAQRIVNERKQGRFTSADDLLRVPGIGKAKLEKMRSYVETD